MNMIPIKLFALLCVAILTTGCATQGKPYDYSAYKESRPHSILVLPPVNNSPDVTATYGVLSQAAYPLAESGYYVFPVALVDETFKQNGLNSPADIHAVPPAKLQEIFGADAGLYMTITEYGSSYRVVSSTTRVTANASLVDLKTGAILWNGSATASSDEDRNNSGGGLAGMLIAALIHQIISNVSDVSYQIAGRTSLRLLSAGQPNAMLYGPRSPNFGKD